MDSVTIRRLRALDISRRTKKAEPVDGTGEKIKAVIKGDYRYPILIRVINGRRVYNLICPRNGRIIGPQMSGYDAVINDYIRRKM